VQERFVAATFLHLRVKQSRTALDRENRKALREELIFKSGPFSRPAAESRIRARLGKTFLQWREAPKDPPRSQEVRPPSLDLRSVIARCAKNFRKVNLKRRITQGDWGKQKELEILAYKVVIGPQRKNCSGVGGDRRKKTVGFFFLLVF